MEADPIRLSRARSEEVKDSVVVSEIVADRNSIDGYKLTNRASIFLRDLDSRTLRLHREDPRTLFKGFEAVLPSTNLIESYDRRWVLNYKSLRMEARAGK